MNNTNAITAIRSMSLDAVSKIRAFEIVNAKRPQIDFTTYHLIHAGMYARTIRLKANTVITGALVKPATILIISGDVTMSNGEENTRITGYHVIPASQHRKQAFVAHADTDMTVLFPTMADSVDAAEKEFTDEAEKLASRRCENVINITGE